MILFCINKHRLLNCIWWQRNSSLLNSHQLKVDLKQANAEESSTIFKSKSVLHIQVNLYQEKYQYQYMAEKRITYHRLSAVMLCRIGLCIIGSKDTSIVRIWIWVGCLCLRYIMFQLDELRKKESRIQTG